VVRFTGPAVVSEWVGGKLGRYDPASEEWKEWDLPGVNPQPYAVYVDDQDLVWLSDLAPMLWSVLTRRRKRSSRLRCPGHRPMCARF